MHQYYAFQLNFLNQYLLHDAQVYVSILHQGLHLDSLYNLFYKLHHDYILYFQANNKKLNIKKHQKTVCLYFISFFKPIMN
jgi:hypothetical protein